MESLALVIVFMFLGILLFSAASIVLSALCWAGKLHIAWGYSFTGGLLVITFWSYLGSVPLGLMATIPLIACVLLLAFRKKAK